MSQATHPLPQGHYGLLNVMKSEFLKIVTLRSTAITLGVTVATALLFTGLGANHAVNHGALFNPGFDSTQRSLTGLIIAGLTGGVFGAMLISGEYSSGTIRTSLAASPKRATLLSAKILVSGILLIAFSEILSFASFFLGQAIFSGGGVKTASLASGVVLRAVVFTGLFISLMALMSFGFGLIFRSTAASLAAFVGVVFVLEFVMHAVSDHYAQYLPIELLVNSIMTTVKTTPLNSFSTSASQGLLFMAIYAAVPLAIGWGLFVKRDA